MNPRVTLINLASLVALAKALGIQEVLACLGYDYVERGDADEAMPELEIVHPGKKGIRKSIRNAVSRVVELIRKAGSKGKETRKRGQV